MPIFQVETRIPEKGRNGRCYPLVVNLGNAKSQTKLVLCLCVVVWPVHIYFLISLLLSPRFWIPGFEHAINVLHHWDIPPYQLKKVKNRPIQIWVNFLHFMFLHIPDYTSMCSCTCSWFSLFGGSVSSYLVTQEFKTFLICICFEYVQFFPLPWFPKQSNAIIICTTFPLSLVWETVYGLEIYGRCVWVLLKQQTIVMAGFTVSLTQSRAIWESSLNEGLSRLGWPVGKSVWRFSSLH